VSIHRLLCATDPPPSVKVPLLVPPHPWHLHAQASTPSAYLLVIQTMNPLSHEANLARFARVNTHARTHTHTHTHTHTQLMTACVHLQLDNGAANAGDQGVRCIMREAYGQVKSLEGLPHREEVTCLIVTAHDVLYHRSVQH
jgi:hypothetical protein